MPFFEDVGRTNALREATSDISNLALGMRKQKESEAITAAKLEEFQINKRKIENELQLQEEQMARYNKPIPLDVLRSQIPIPAAADYAENVAKSYGLIDESGEVPTIKAGYVQEIYKVMHEPFHSENLSKIELTATRTAWTQAQQELDAYRQGKTQQQLQQDKKFAMLLQNVQTAQTNYLGSVDKNKALVQFNHDVMVQFTPESALKYMQTGDSSVLKAETRGRGGSGGAGAGGASGKTSLERAYNQFRQEPGNENVSLVEFKNNYWNAGGSKGSVSDSFAMSRIQEMVDYDKDKTATWFSRFAGLKKRGMSGTEALDTVLQEIQRGPVGNQPGNVLKPSHGSATTQTGPTDYSSLWK